MSDFKRILVPTDFGDAAGAALDVAMAMAKVFESRLTLLHAYIIPTGYVYPDALLWPVDELSRAAKSALDDAVRRARASYPNVEGVLVCGEPWYQIVEMATRSKADLIVVGTHGRRGVPRLLLGSVAQKLVRLSPVPVLTTPNPEARNED